MPLEKRGTVWMLDDVDTDHGPEAVDNARVIGYVTVRERAEKTLKNQNLRLKDELAKLQDEIKQLKAKPTPKGRQVLNTAGFDLRSFIAGVVALAALLLVIFNLGLIGRGIKTAASTSIGDLIGGLTIGWILAAAAAIWLFLSWKRHRTAQPVSSNRQNLWQTMKENLDRNRGR